MGNRDKADSSKEIVLRFGLLIDKIIKDNTIRFEIKSNNTGVPDAEVILLVEAWLDKMKESFRQPIRDGFTSFHQPKDDGDDGK